MTAAFEMAATGLSLPHAPTADHLETAHVVNEYFSEYFTGRKFTAKYLEGADWPKGTRVADFVAGCIARLVRVWDPPPPPPSEEELRWQEIDTNGLARLNVGSSRVPRGDPNKKRRTYRL